MNAPRRPSEPRTPPGSAALRSDDRVQDAAALSVAKRMAEDLRDRALSALGGESVPGAIRERIGEQLLEYLHPWVVQVARAERLAQIGRLAATAAHELRNPLSVIETSAYIIGQAAGADERIARHARKIADQVGLASQFVADMLQTVRAQPIVVEDFDVGAAVRASVEHFPHGSGIRISVTAGSEPVHVRSHPRALHQVLVNTLQNAADAIEGNGTIDVVVSRDAHDVVVSVTDDGPGVPAHLAETVFEPLFTTKVDGTGLGLAFARATMRQVGGDLRLANPAARGARFEIYMPLATDPAVEHG